MWEDLGVELLNEKQWVMLEFIKENNYGHAQRCCTQMFMYWLRVDTEASWNMLIAALKEIGQHSLAICIMKDILKGFGHSYILCIYCLIIASYIQRLIQEVIVSCTSTDESINIHVHYLWL